MQKLYKNAALRGCIFSVIVVVYRKFNMFPPNHFESNEKTSKLSVEETLENLIKLSAEGASRL